MNKGMLASQTMPVTLSPADQIEVRVFDDVVVERIRQDRKWGIQNHRPEMWLAILGEEFGEACKALLSDKFDGYDGEQGGLRAELIQCAAVAIAAVACIDRRKKWVGKSTPIPDTLSVRARKALNRGGITTLEELSAHSPRDLFKIRSCGKLTVKEFRDVLAAHGMKLVEESP